MSLSATLFGRDSAIFKATNILGLIATGDSSIDAAKKAGGIKDVSSVDHDSTSILGLFGTFCTVVKGN